MIIKKTLFIAVLVALAAMLVPGQHLWAGFEGGDPPDWDKVQGPELWGVVTIYCSLASNVAAIRVKRIKDCNVQVQTLFDTATIIAAGCPADSNAYLYMTFNENTFFPNDPDIPDNGVPIVTKIKNWDAVVEGTEPNVTKKISFDAQIKFEMP